MTVPANLAARHYAEQAVLAAIITEREAMAAFKAAPTGRDMPELRAWRTAHDAVNDAADVYYAAVQAVNRTADPVVENITEPGTYEVHDCPGGAYVITETPAGITAVAPIKRVDADGAEVPDLLAALRASMERHKESRSAADLRALYETTPEPDFDPADQYDSTTGDVRFGHRLGCDYGAIDLPAQEVRDAPPR